MGARPIKHLHVKAWRSNLLARFLFTHLVGEKCEMTRSTVHMFCREITITPYLDPDGGSSSKSGRQPDCRHMGVDTQTARLSHAAPSLLYRLTSCLDAAMA